MTKKQKKMLYRILLAAALLLAAVIVSDIPALHVDGWLKLDNPADIQNLFQMTP